MILRLAKLIATGLLCMAAVAAQSAESAADFYKGRQLTIVVGYGPGGGYDIYARLLARYLPRHMPGAPTTVVQNMPGAGSLRAANFLYNSAPRDGTTFGTFARNLPLMGIMGNNPAVQYDARKFSWIGSSSSYHDDAYLLITRKDAAVKSIADARRKDGPPLILGTSGEGSPGHDVPILLRDTLDLNIKTVAGFPDGSSIFLAVDRREVDGRSIDLYSAMSARPEWLDPKGEMQVLLQFGRATRHPRFPNAPTARELAPDQRARTLIELAEVPFNLSRTYAAPPNVPADRLAALRAGFLAAHRDPQLLEEAVKLKLDIDPGSAEEILQQIELVANAPPDILIQLQKLYAASKG